ncbi:xylose isomerase-like protein [Naematelia encephala]|uniref:Apurinic-apyrimidinic endonuclease 1 n=1 Tax=Naematelia encephala TaxID=71784 RepID=A0A1Y2BCX3_9TREE|nr:xylose isomerase-like protein [Naematelia encephala]
MSPIRSASKRGIPASSPSLTPPPDLQSKAAKKPRASKVKVSPAGKKVNDQAKTNGTVATDDIKRDDDDLPPSRPTKKPRGQGKLWPPTELDPSDHPSRAGYPIYNLPPLQVPRNGGIGPIDDVGNSKRPHLLGAHVSIGGGPATALLRASKAGANGLAMFVKSQRQWKSNPYEAEAVQRFLDLSTSKDLGGLGYPKESILVHGSYLINLGNPDKEKWETSYQCFKDDIFRCHQLGIGLYNWHPGSTVGMCTKEESYASIAKAINRVHGEVPEVICVIENMANANSNIIGTTFHDLASIIALVTDRSRVRICLDTCHLFAAGYDIRTPETYRETFRKFNEEVGNGYLAGVHLNDSKADLGGCKDLHENIGLGKIGLSAFRMIMRDPLFSGIPLVLETPAPEKALESGELSVWTSEIKLLYEIQGINDEEWVTREGEIEKRWRAERDKLNPPKEKKVKGKKSDEDGNGKKGKGGGGGGRGKGKKVKKEEDDEESGCESHTD